MKLPSDISGWTSWYQSLLLHMQDNGGKLSGAEVDALVLARKLKFGMSSWAGNHDIGDFLVPAQCSHIYRLHRLVRVGALRRRVMGKEPGRVFYYPPKVKP